MLEILTQLFSVVLVGAALIVAISIAHKSQARVWRLLGWFACVMALTLVMVEAYTWYRRGDWQIKTAYQFWADINRSSLIWMNNNAPQAIWAPIDFILHFPSWLVLIVFGIMLLVFDHRQLQKTKTGEKPPTLRKRLKDWLRKMQKEEEEEA